MKRARGLLAGMLMAVPCALALNPALDLSQYAHTVWRNSDGFSRRIIYSIAQTPDGYLWPGTEFEAGRVPSRIGTANGLASWKGGRLTRYAELAGQRIAPHMEDREGSVWAGGLGTPTGRLCAIRHGSVECYGEDGRFGSGVLSLFEHRGDLWVGAATGLWKWKFEAYLLPDGGQFTPYRMLRDSPRKLAASTNYNRRGTRDADRNRGSTVFMVLEEYTCQTRPFEFW
jgi:ligand-binding sensor domain-containing protein